jgi:hypothetical protein
MKFIVNHKFLILILLFILSISTLQRCVINGLFYQNDGCNNFKKEFADFETKLGLEKNSNTKDKKVNLIIFDFGQPLQDSTGVTVISKTMNLSTMPSHADKTVKIIKDYAANVVNITHVNATVKNKQNNAISFSEEFDKAIDASNKGDIFFIILNDPSLKYPLEGDKDQLKRIKNAIVKNKIVVIESSGNDQTQLDTVNMKPSKAIVVGGAIPKEMSTEYDVSECSNYGQRVDVYGPSCTKPFTNKEPFCQSSSGSAVITAMAVNLQYECMKSNHKFLNSAEMQDIFRNAPSDLFVTEPSNYSSPITKKIPQYSKILLYAKQKYFLLPKK